MNTRRALVLFLGSALLLFVLGCSATRTRESTGEYFDDAAITPGLTRPFSRSHR